MKGELKRIFFDNNMIRNVWIILKMVQGDIQLSLCLLECV